MLNHLAVTWYLAIVSLTGADVEAPIYSSELIFPLETWHNHGSCIVECPNEDLLVCWFHGSGERNADDVAILGARKVKASGQWTSPFVMADTPDFPDTNCCMIIDPENRLWLLWPTILANTWESALMKYKISSNYMMPEGPPVWEVMEVLHMKPAEDFEQKVRSATETYLATLEIPEDMTKLVEDWKTRNYQQAADKLTRRLGWFTRAHPYILEDRTMLVGLYSDGFSFSLVALTDDWGKTWRFSDPIVGGGNIQPSFARKKDGTLVAYMRDNGPAPKRVHVSESKDGGKTWSIVHDHPQLPNPGSGLELANLADGDWICVYNDTESGRHSLAVSISHEEGTTWRWTRHLESVPPGQGSFAYPSVIQGRDGMLHVSYSYAAPTPEGERKSIKHATFNKAWVLEGDQPASAPSPAVSGGPAALTRKEAPMRICRYMESNRVQLGFFFDEILVPLEKAAQQFAELPLSENILDYLPNGRYSDAAHRVAAWLESHPDELKAASVSVQSVRLLRPIENPGKILLLAGNYAEHIQEEGSVPVERHETFPYVFMKPRTALNHPNTPIPIPKVSPDHIDYEAELGVVIGKTARHVPEEHALDYVAGYTVVNDVSDRQFRPNPNRKPREKDRFFDWLHGKWHDGFFPLGPCIVSAKSIGDPQQLQIKLLVNGEVRQDGSTSQMIFPVAAIIEFISQWVTLEPGDVIATGTLAGVAMTSGRFLKPGDVIDASIEGIGTLHNPMVSEE